MSFNTPHVIAATSVVAAIVLLQVCDVSSSLCRHDCPWDMQCPTLPDDCELTRRTCGCCFECKGKVGANCSHIYYGLPCESGLMCVNRRGVALPVVEWLSDFGFEGKCQKVDMCQLLTPSGYGLLMDMRDPEKPTANVVHGEAGIAD